MASMSWTWADLWNWFEQIEEDSTKSYMLKQIFDIQWVKRLSVDGQVDVMKDAPFEVMKWLKKLYPDCLKPETVSILNDILDARYKPKRRTKRK